MKLPPPPYSGPWDAEILRIVDADTFDARVELPFHTDRRERFRLMDYSAPEKRTEAGRNAIIWVTTYMPPGSRVKIMTRWIPSSGEAMTLGRYLGAFYLKDDFSDEWTLLGEAETVAGHARPGAFEG